jgi:hypothetical protein
MECKFCKGNWKKTGSRRIVCNVITVRDVENISKLFISIWPINLRLSSLVNPELQYS